MEPPKAVVGVIRSDPANEVPIGAGIKFMSCLMSHTIDDASAWVKDWESFHGTVLAVAFLDSEHHRIEGSAVVVAPGIAIAAAHVFASRIDAGLDGREQIYCYGITRAGMQIWRTQKIILVPNSDLAILGLELNSPLPADNTMFQTMITTRVPKIGERVTIYGFRASEEVFLRSEYAWGGNLLVCAGNVSERYVKGRDSVMMPWPVIEVDCPSWGGMSGGPVFDSSGKVLGLLSSSLSADSGNGPSYVSLLIPALMARFQGGWPSPLFKQPRTLWEDERSCHIDRRDTFKVVRDEATGQTYTAFSIWE